MDVSGLLLQEHVMIPDLFPFMLLTSGVLVWTEPRMAAGQDIRKSGQQEIVSRSTRLRKPAVSLPIFSRAL